MLSVCADAPTPAATTGPSALASGARPASTQGLQSFRPSIQPPRPRFLLIRRIADHDRDRLLALDAVGLLARSRDRLHRDRELRLGRIGIPGLSVM